MKKYRLSPELYLGYGLATACFLLNALLAWKLPYFSEHKIYYDSAPYLVVLLVIYLIYAVHIRIAKKKSISDLVIVIYAFLGFWEFAYKWGWVKNDLLIPSPEGLFHVFVEKPDEIYADVIGSLQLLFWGFLLAIVLGTVLGLLAGWIPRIREVLLPISNVITLIPPLMFSAYLVMSLSTFRQAAIGVIFLAVFWPTFQQTVARVGQIDPSIIEAARTMGVGTAGMLGRVIFPYCLPGIIKSISRSLRGAFMCLTGAEMLGMNLGVGYFIEKYKSFADYRCVLAGIVTVGVITTVIDILVGRMEKAIIKWDY